MQLATVRHLWGVNFQDWSLAFPRIKANGYVAVETCPYSLSENERSSLKSMCLNNNLKLVYQIHTDAYSKFPKRDKTVEGHIASFEAQLKDVTTNYSDIVLFVNSHSGYDGWNAQQRDMFFAAAAELEKNFPTVICHETHRSRVLYNPWVTAELVDKFPNLKLTADLSHWFNVCERKLDDEMDVIEKIASRIHHIHARVGFAQGPQVPDPSNALWIEWLEAHERCWDTIWATLHKNGVKATYLEPEFGPPPYCWTTGYGDPVVDIWRVCEWITKREVSRFAEKYH